MVRGAIQRKGARAQSGFTVVEVIIFIAISGALLALAMVSVSGSVRNARFEDDVRSTESYLQRQYSEVASGRNIRDTTLRCTGGVVSAGPSAAPGTSTCIVLGRLLSVDVGGDTITSRYIVADGTATMSGATESAKIMSLGPTVVDDSLLNGSFQNPWGAVYQQMVDGTATNINSLAIIRSPDSGRMVIYHQLVASVTGTTTLALTDAQLNRKASLCLYSSELTGGRKGYVNVAAGQGQGVIQADLATAPGVC